MPVTRGIFWWALSVLSVIVIVGSVRHRQLTVQGVTMAHISKQPLIPV